MKFIIQIAVRAHSCQDAICSYPDNSSLNLGGAISLVHFVAVIKETIWYMVQNRFSVLLNMPVVGSKECCWNSSKWLCKLDFKWAQYISYNKYIILTECKSKLSSSNLKFDYILDIIQLVKTKTEFILFKKCITTNIFCRGSFTNYSREQNSTTHLLWWS